MRHTILAASALLMLASSAALLAADNWPQWRGPGLNGVSKETGLARTWSPTENIAWTVPTPSRTGSTPIIWGRHRLPECRHRRIQRWPGVVGG